MAATVHRQLHIYTSRPKVRLVLRVTFSIRADVARRDIDGVTFVGSDCYERRTIRNHLNSNQGSVGSASRMRWPCAEYITRLC